MATPEHPSGTDHSVGRMDTEIPIYYTAEPGAITLPLAFGGEDYQFEIYQGWVRCWSSVDGMNSQIYNDNFLAKLLADLELRSLVQERLERIQRTVRELAAAAGPDAPASVKQLVTSLASDIKGVLAEIETRDDYA